MKRLPFLFAVIVALCLSACGGKTITTSDPDSLFYADTVAVEEVTNPAADAANAIVAQLQKQMDTTDLECVKDIARDITKHLKELIGQQDMEGVESYTAIINNFIAENADKIREIGAAEILSDAITNMEGVPTDVIQATTQALEGIKTPALNAAVSAIEKGCNEH